MALMSQRVRSEKKRFGRNNKIVANCMKIIFYLTVNNDKPKLLASLVFVCTTEIVLMRDAILAPAAKQ